jgi:2-keto-3-deoxy-L-rhamnonate aldolase RhmA
MEAQMTARFKAKLAARQPVVVMNPDYPSASLVEFVARLGVDAVMIDTEQGSPDVESVEEMARAARAAGLCALVRIFSPDPWVIERYMLRGVHGIVVPRLDSAAAARRVVEDVHYCFPGNAEEKVVVVQIETSNAVAELDRFLAIEGIDCLFIGSVDLAKSLGHQGDFRKPEVMAVLEPTGVGDAFRAGFLSALAWGLSLEHAAEVGCVLAAYVVETVGPQDYTFTAEQFLARLDASYGGEAADAVRPHLQG